MSRKTTFHMLLTLAAVICLSSAAAVAQEPKFIKLFRDREEKQREEERSRLTRDQAEKDFAAAKQAAAAASAEDRPAAQQRVEQAGAAVDQANAGVNQASDAIQAIDGEIITSGKLPPFPPGRNPLERHTPLWSGKGSALKQLEGIKAAGGVVGGIKIDGGDPNRDPRTPTPTIVKTLMTKAEIEEQRKNIAQAQWESEQDFQALQDANAQNIAGVQAQVRYAEQVAAQVAALVAEINAHVDAAAFVDRNDDAAIAAYNRETDRLYYRYKQLTGKDIGYSYQPAR